MLVKTGVSVIEAGDGTTALAAIRNPRPIDLLVLDITIPRDSSRVVFAEAARLRPNMRVIVTSAYTEEAAALSLQGQIRYFLRKPYQLGDLVELIRRASC